LFSKANIRLILLSLGLLTLGYILLGQGPVYNHLSWTISPLILVGVYCILVPIAILLRPKDEKK